MMSEYMRTTCRVCGNSNLVSFADIGETPLADKFINKEEIADEQSYPLNVKVCPQCFLVQQVCDVPGELLYGNDYAFFSSASPASVKYFEDYAKQVLKKYPKQCDDFIVEIASNDGLLLKQFKDRADVLGVDPAEPAAKAARNDGVPTLISPFNTDTANKIKEELGKASLIIANNVVAHVVDVNDMIEGVSQLLDDDGVFVMECQYLPQLLFNNEFDHIYHEHRSFFSLHSLTSLLNKHRITVEDVIKTNAQGGSIRVFCKKYHSIDIPESVAMVLDNELRQGILNVETYKGFIDRVKYIKDELKQLLEDLKEQGKTVYGYGASAKSCTLLNYCGIDERLLPCILDKTPYKIGKVAPGSHIPIVDSLDKEPDYYLLLIWNYLPSILMRERQYLLDGGHFIIPIATPHII